MYKRIHCLIIAFLGLFSPALFALGLGGAVVESYLGQPLNVRVELISQSSEELQSITTGLASADDFELLGLSRSAITVPLEFVLVTDTDQPYIHITSQLEVNDPVVQVLVEVIWASGRMLREYTLFLDPPTIDSAAPPVVIKPAPRPAPVEEPVPEITTPPVAVVQRTVVPETQEARQEEPVTEDTGSDEILTAKSDPAESKSEQTAEQEPQRSDDRNSDDEVYGPVARGETLWGIARDFSRGTGYSINQAMLALQRKNPKAFIRDNINSLKRGAILRLPAFNEMAELTSREAMLEAMRQEEEHQSGTRVAVADVSTPTVADSGGYQESVTEPAAEPDIEEDSGHLELVPPAEADQQDSNLPEQLPEQDDSGNLMRQELSRTEEELLNAQQENSYLTQRIQELEAEVEAGTDKTTGIEDSSLAKLESNLAKERSSDQPEPQVAITPGGEKQAWYAGKTGLIAGIAAILIALIVWGLRRRNAASIESDRA
jgi:pilus assembly protein FimV